MAGMKFHRRRFNLEDIDRSGKEVVQTVDDPLQRQGACGFQMGHLGQGMNAGIGPSRPLEIHLSAEELPGRIRQRSLYAPGVGLGLPAAEAGPVVFERQLVFVTGGSRRLSSAIRRQTPPDHGAVPD